MLTKAQKVFFTRARYFLVVGVFLGLVVWFSFARIVKIESGWSLVVLSLPKPNQLAVFHYPNLDSPLRYAWVVNRTEDKFFVELENKEVLEIGPENMVGRLWRWDRLSKNESILKRE